MNMVRISPDGAISGLAHVVVVILFDDPSLTAPHHWTVGTTKYSACGCWWDLDLNVGQSADWESHRKQIEPVRFISHQSVLVPLLWG